jgi:hypothetical protein
MSPPSPVSGERLLDHPGHDPVGALSGFEAVAAAE